jgi:hypothetical protein
VKQNEAEKVLSSVATAVGRCTTGLRAEPEGSAHSAISVDLKAMHDLMDEFSLPASLRRRRPVTTFRLCWTAPGKYGRLTGHVSRNNPQRLAFMANGADCLPRAASLCFAAVQQSEMVPTWNTPWFMPAPAPRSKTRSFWQFWSG